MQWTKQLLEDKNYSYYDEHQHMELGPWAETFIKNLEKSHRMVVFLTPEYIQEAKSRFETSQALDYMLENKTKLIFVCFPGVRKVLRKTKGLKFTKDLVKAVTIPQGYERGMRNNSYLRQLSESSNNEQDT